MEPILSWLKVRLSKTFKLALIPVLENFRRFQLRTKIKIKKCQKINFMYVPITPWTLYKKHSRNVTEKKITRQQIGR